MTTNFAGVVALLLCASTTLADEDSLQFLISKSDLVVVGEVESNLDPFSDRFVPEYDAKIKVGHVYRGWRITSLSAPQMHGINEKEIAKIKPGTEMKAKIVRRRGFKDPIVGAITREGQQYVLFLRAREQGNIWETSDRWLGLQPATPSMSEQLGEEAAKYNKAQKSLSRITPGLIRYDVHAISQNNPLRDTREKGTYAFRDLPCLRVTIDFETVGEPNSNDGLDSSHDKIKAVSKPFFEFTPDDN